MLVVPMKINVGIGIDTVGGVSLPNGSPSSCTVTVLSSSSLKVDWTNGATNHDDSEIEASTDGLSYSVVISVSANIITYTHSSLTSNYYYYRIRHRKGSSYSQYSNIAQNDIPLTVLDTSKTVDTFDYQYGITKNVNNQISAWAGELGLITLDQVGTTDAQKPVFTSEGVLLDGINDRIWKSFTYNQPESIFIVFKQLSWTLNDRIFDGSTASKGVMVQSATANNLVVSAGSASSSIDLSLDKWCVARILFNGANSEFYIDTNGVAGNFGSNNMGGFTLGATGGGGASWSNILVKKIILRKVVESETDKNDIYNYLKDKYGASYQLTSTGNGSGVATLKLTVSDTVTLRVTGNARFYDNIEGTTNAGLSRTITSGAERTVYLKLTTGNELLKISDILKITQINSWTSGTNAPSLGGSIDNFVNCTKIDIQGNNTITGEVAVLSLLTYLDVRGDNTINTYTSGKTWANNQDTVKLIQAYSYGLSSTEVDNLLTDLDNVANWTGNKVIYLPLPNNARTAASDAAVASLEGKGVTITINQLVPMIAFMDDDGSEESYTVVKPMFDALGFKASFGITTGWTDTDGFMTSAQIQQCAADGHEITSHSVTHPHYYLIPEADVIDELVDSKAFLESLGLTIKGHTSPFGDNSASVINNVLDYYDALFAGAGGDPVNELPVNLRTGIGRVIADYAVTSTLTGYVDKVINDAGASVLLFYAHPRVWDATQTARIQSLLNYINSKGLKTIGAMDIVEKIKTYFPQQWTID